MTFETIIFEEEGGVATVTLDRPESANVLDLTMAEELAKVAIRCDEDPAIRAVILTGQGRFFSAGGDLKSFATAGAGLGALIKEMTLHFHGAVSRLSRMDPPVIAAVNGVAAGAGFSMAAACDLIVAAESATFVSAYTAAALSPDGSSTYFLPRMVGMRRAAELMLTNRTLSAAEALEWGFVNRVVADEQLSAEVAALAGRLAAGPTRAFGAVKGMLHASLDSSLETQMEMEARLIADMTRTDDGLEGIAAFVDKREPTFHGR